MRVKAKVEDGHLKVVIEASDVAERWFLKQLMEHGASMELKNIGNSWTTIVLTGLTSEEAELAVIDRELTEVCRP